MNVENQKNKTKKIMEMTKIKTVFGKCRCCNTEGHHRDLMKEYNLNGITESYYNMFMECFNLFLSTTAELSRLICGACIVRLRDAVAFRTMVASTEQELLGSVLGKETVFINVPMQHIMEPEVEIKSEQTTDVKWESTLTNDEHELYGDASETGDHLDYKPHELLQCVKGEFLGSCENEYLVEGEAEFVAKYQVPNFRLPTRTTLYANRMSGFVHHLDMLRGKLVFPKMLERLLDESEDDIAKRKRNMANGKKKTASRQRLKHVMEVRGERSTFLCNQCNRVYDNQKTLLHHKRWIHVKMLENKCNICDSRFHLPSMLTDHMAAHTGEKKVEKFSDSSLNCKDTGAVTVFALKQED